MISGCSLGSSHFLYVLQVFGKRMILGAINEVETIWCTSKQISIWIRSGSCFRSFWEFEPPFLLGNLDVVLVDSTFRAAFQCILALLSLFSCMPDILFFSVWSISLSLLLFLSLSRCAPFLESRVKMPSCASSFKLWTKHLVSHRRRCSKDLKPYKKYLRIWNLEPHPRPRSRRADRFWLLSLVAFNSS